MTKEKQMALSMTCRHCGTVVTAATEDEMVTNVQAHMSGHGKPVKDRDHILSRLHRLQRRGHEPPS